MLTHSVVGTSGCREYESPGVVLVLVGWPTLDKSRSRFADIFAVVERGRLRVGDRRRVEYPSDPRHRHKRRILAMADEEEAAQAARRRHGLGIDPRSARDDTPATQQASEVQSPRP